MTIVCAIHEPGVGTWIGGDTLVSSNDSVIGHKEKWIEGNGCALAVTGSCAASTALLDHAQEMDPQWTAAQLFLWAKSVLDGYGFKPKEADGCPPWYDCSVLFATPTRVISVDSQGGAVVFGDMQFASRGSGADVADGAAFVSRRARYHPQKILADAIDAAKEFVTSCGGETSIRCLWIAG